MLANINLHQLLFIDIETVPEQPSFKKLSSSMQELWAAKHTHLKMENEDAETGYLKRAGVYAEFAKVICISLGYFRTEKESLNLTFRVKSFYGHNEKMLLDEFSALIRTSFDNPERFQFCGHNIREFDTPFLSRRMLINGITLPEMFDNSGKRPWQINDIDTLQLWKFGDYKNYVSLKLLAEILGVPSSKSDIDGKDVCRVYWEEDNLQRIVDYCQRDVITTARLLQKFKGSSTFISDSEIVIV
ncbi:MAG: ribonuclease H-like domain-containing protein [Bacteroidetes bacterium]|nr:ribonuclease H-like domain-containing protein [Bacteroidota bacterium]